jgi:hypothetical protein
MDKAKAAGLPIADEDMAALQPDPTALPHPDVKLPLSVRLVSAVDRVHYTVSPLDGWTNPPKTCVVETGANEQAAVEIGAVEVMTAAMQRNVAALWESAAATAAQLNFPIDGAADALLTLFQGRCPLITNDNELATARNSAVQLVAETIRGAQAMNFHVLAEVFLNQALFHLQPLFPFTDEPS